VDSFDLAISFFGAQAHLQNLQVKLVNQGHRVKVKVTVAKKHVSCSQVVCCRLKGSLVPGFSLIVLNDTISIQSL